jgi:uncharacterized membrane protein YgcG
MKRPGDGARAAARALPVVAVLVLAASWALPAAAQERILSYDTEIEVLADGTLEIAEHITVLAQGSAIRRGIYRDFPTRYRDRFGNRVRVSLDVLGVERDGEPEPWFTERRSNGVRINTGDDTFLVVPAEYTFTIRYRTTRQLGFFDAHDELYWNAIGTGWTFPIERGSVRVRLPEAIPVAEMSVVGYTGPQGAQGSAYAAELMGPGVALFTLTAPLPPGHGFTIVHSFPKGVVAEPSRMDRLRWLLTDNRGVLMALAGLAGLLFFCIRRWQEVGRDPPKGVVFPRYEPPRGWSPAAIRYLRRMGYDDRCFTADILALAVAGHLRIRQQGKGRKEKWRLEQTTSGTHAAPSEQALLRELFEGGPAVVTLEQKNGSTLRAARSAQRQALDEQLHGPYFRRNGKSTFQAVLITFVTGALAFLVSGGNGIPFIFITLIVMVAVSAVFGFLVRAPTPEGRKALDEVAGLQLYLTVAERDELAGMKGPGPTGSGEAPPPLDAGRYEALLPFAVALAVEDAWTHKFTAAVGAAAAAEAASRMHWYAGRGPVTDLGSFSRSIGSSLNSQIASAATPPGSSSGGGGGGSSGGGGGGGGGGGR